MSNSYFSCKTNKAPHTYRTGESIVFQLQYRKDGCAICAPLFKWNVYADFGYQASGVSKGESGTFSVTACLDRPGFVYVTAVALDENGRPLPESDKFYGGAGVEIESIREITKEPLDYQKFWDICQKEVFAIDPDIIEKQELPRDPEHPIHDIYDIKVTCAGGIPVSGILTIPRDGKKHPARVIYQGYGVKSAWFNFSDEEIIFCINAHGIQNNKPQEYYDALMNGRLLRYGFNSEENKNPHTCYFKYMMIRAAQALRFVMSLSEWDGEHLIARGGSQGAVQAMHATYLIPQVTTLDIFIPWLCDIAAETSGRLCGWGDFSGNAVRYFDLALRAKSIQTKTVIIAGLGDYTAPPSGITAMYHNLQGEKSLTLVQNREHTYVSPEAEDFLVDFF